MLRTSHPALIFPILLSPDLVKIMSHFTGEDKSRIKTVILILSQGGSLETPSCLETAEPGNSLAGGRKLPLLPEWDPVVPPGLGMPTVLS